MSEIPLPDRPMRRRRTLEQRLELARLAEDKAALRLSRKAQKVKQFEAVAKARERKLDTRRKIIVGALAWEHRDHDGLFKKALMALLDDYVLKDEERALVGLDPLPPEVLAKALAEQEARTKLRRRGNAGKGTDE
jgi:hypothetical protein